MQQDLFLEPLAFLYGDAARQAVHARLALPFLGQPHIAFPMVQSFNKDGSQSISLLNDLPKSWTPYIKILSAKLPLAGLPKGPLIMGILNVTPDSFSDGGKHYHKEDAVRAGMQMIQEGATILDIGGESTRPGAVPITPFEECERIIPVIKQLKGAGALISVDTRHAYTMARVLDVGVDIINDVSALEDPQSANIIAQAQCPVVLMHMRGTPQTMSKYYHYENVIFEVLSELSKKIQKAEQAGIKRQNIIVDPGIGFAKEYSHNIALLKHLPVFASLGCRFLLAASRKRFIKQSINSSVHDHYDWGTMTASLPFMMFGDGIVRVHNVPAMLQSLNVWQALYQK
ncbi:dihydropteroate synthase [Commensalibacter oyaizuii]|uniref:Dihydropteroate synthase n=1 Tax=Commensalibacter oyaizuii TaxID=3043873 RepID=A0ABT6Q064_9PROT|nr:dihydropteroate synthase [Commensalibacter sp. TBRC 16381]MDI2089879.1 dihydropteroate synthase [Commensalibacter sp. TBRC 16381]